MPQKPANKLMKWEYPKRSGISIRRITNQNQGQEFGESFQVNVPAEVTGTTRKRKQCNTIEQAEKFAEEQYVGKSEEGHGYFEITSDERAEFRHCLPKLRDAGISLTQATDHAISTLRPAGGARTIDQIAQELMDSKKLRYERGDISERTERDFRHRATKFAEEFKGNLASEFQLNGQIEIKQWIIEMENEARTNQNYLSVIGELMKYAVQKRYIIYNPLDAFSDVERKEMCGSGKKKQPDILTIKEAKRLIDAAYETEDEFGLLAAVTLGLFCGIRTEEIKKLQWRAVRLEEGFITISEEIAKKRRIRQVTISENAKKWLSLVEDKSGAVVEHEYYTHYQKKFKKLWTAAKFPEWKANAMRHSFGSYHYALYGDSMKTSKEMGHKSNDDVLFSHYRALTTEKDGKAYFSISPKNLEK